MENRRLFLRKLVGHLKRGQARERDFAETKARCEVQCDAVCPEDSGIHHHPEL